MKTNKRTVEVLFLDGCPNISAAIRQARDAIAASGVDADLRLVRVEDNAEAVARRFLGSPSIHVDKLDVDIASRSRSDFGLHCRVYPKDGHLERVPPSQWIEEALRTV